MYGNCSHNSITSFSYSSWKIYQVGACSSLIGQINLAFLFFEECLKSYTFRTFCKELVPLKGPCFSTKCKIAF